MEAFAVSLMVMSVCGVIGFMFHVYYKDKGKDLTIEAQKEHIEHLKWVRRNLENSIRRKDCERRSDILKKYFPKRTTKKK